MAAGFESVAVRFLAFEESPIVFANEVRRARRCQSQPRSPGALSDVQRHRQRVLGGSRIVARRESGLATKVECDVLDVSVLWEVERYVPR